MSAETNLRCALLFAFAVCLGSCDEPSSPDNPPAVYVLETVGGQPLPVSVRQVPGADGATIIVTVFDDTLTFDENGRGTRGGSRQSLTTVSNGQVVDETMFSFGRAGLSYRVVDGLIRFQPDPPDFEFNAELGVRITPPREPVFLSYFQQYFVASVSGAVITVYLVAEGAEPSGTPYVYRRVN